MAANLRIFLYILKFLVKTSNICAIPAILFTGTVPVLFVVIAAAVTGSVVAAAVAFSAGLSTIVACGAVGTGAGRRCRAVFGRNADF